jgi:hypothetical protein
MFTEKTPEEIAALNSEELKAYNAEKKAHEKSIKDAEKVTNDKSAGATQEFYEKKGKETLENYKTGGSAATVNLTNKTLVEFTEDFGYFKKGHKQEVSDVALAIYENAKVVKKL